MSPQEQTLFNLYMQYRRSPSQMVKDNLLSKVKQLGEVKKKKGQRHFYNEEGETLLCKAIIDSSDALARDLIETERFGVNEPSKNGMYPIHHAVQKGATNLVHILIQCGASVNVQEKQQQNTPLLMALKQTIVDVKMVNLLVNKGADFNVTNLYAESALKLAKAYDETDPKEKIGPIFERRYKNVRSVPGGTMMRTEIEQLQKQMDTMKTDQKELDKRISKNKMELEDHKKETDQQFQKTMRMIQQTTQNVNSLVPRERQQDVSLEDETEYANDGDLYHDNVVTGAASPQNSRVHLNQVFHTNTGRPDCQYDHIQDQNGLIDQFTKDILQKNMHAFVQNVKIVRILTDLCSQQVITHRELEEARAKDNRECDVAEKVYLGLMRGTVRKLRRAKDVLIRDGQRQVANLIPDV